MYPNKIPDLRDFSSRCLLRQCVSVRAISVLFGAEQFAEYAHTPCWYLLIRL